MSDLSILSWHDLHVLCEQLQADAYGEALEKYIANCTAFDLARVRRCIEARDDADRRVQVDRREAAIAMVIVGSQLDIYDGSDDAPAFCLPSEFGEWLSTHRPDVRLYRHGCRVFDAATGAYLCTMTAVERARAEAEAVKCS